MGQNVHGSEKYRELIARMSEPSKRRQRGGTLAWIEGHEQKELISALMAEQAKTQAAGQGLSYDEFVERVLRPEFNYPYEGAAVRSYVLKYHSQNGA